LPSGGMIQKTIKKHSIALIATSKEHLLDREILPIVNNYYYQFIENLSKSKMKSLHITLFEMINHIDIKAKWYA
jgi:hypothetical protein